MCVLFSAVGPSEEMVEESFSQKARVEAGTHVNPGQQGGSVGAPHCAPACPQGPVLTVNVPELVATPPGVVIAIFPVAAPVGTVAVTCVAELTLKVVAATPPNVTLVACVSPVPLMTTWVPTGPLIGLKLEITGITLNFLLLTRIPEGVETVTDPVVPVTGTTAVI